VGGKRRKRIVSGMAFACRDSTSAWSKAICLRPSRRPVSMTRNEGDAPRFMRGLRPSAVLLLEIGVRPRFLFHDPQLPADLPHVRLVRLEWIARDVARRRVAIGPVA